MIQAVSTQWTNYASTLMARRAVKMHRPRSIWRRSADIVGSASARSAAVPWWRNPCRRGWWWCRRRCRWPSWRAPPAVCCSASPQSSLCVSRSRTSSSSRSSSQTSCRYTWKKILKISVMMMMIMMMMMISTSHEIVRPLLICKQMVKTLPIAKKHINLYRISNIDNLE